MKRRIKGVVIASAVAATLLMGACTQRIPLAGSVSMASDTQSDAKKASCGANKHKTNQCKAHKADNL